MNATQLAWKHRWGLIGTIFLHLGFVLYSREKVVVEYESIFKPDVVEIDFDQTDIITEEEKLNEAVVGPDGKIINTDFDVKDKREKTNGRYNAAFDKSSVDEQIRQELKALENAEQDKINKMRGDDPNKTKVNDPNKTKTEVDPNKVLEKDPEKGASSGGMAGTTTAEYDLKDRRIEGKLPKPSYTCIGSGKLVVKIRVNRSGKVISAFVDPTKSEYTEQCMKIGAEKYAMRAKFEASATASDPQDGTITYRYVQQ